MENSEICVRLIDQSLQGFDHVSGLGDVDFSGTSKLRLFRGCGMRGLFLIGNMKLVFFCWEN